MCTYTCVHIYQAAASAMPAAAWPWTGLVEGATRREKGASAKETA